MTAAWRVLEYVPKSAKYKEWPERQVYLGFYIPDCEPRVISEGAHVHESVVRRMDAMPGYRPVNLPTSFAIVPMPAGPEVAVAEVDVAPVDVAPAEPVPPPPLEQGGARSAPDDGLSSRTP